MSDTPATPAEQTITEQTTMATTAVIGTGSSHVMGCVKFFDKSAGFGFISVLKTAEFPQFSEKDIFVHYSGIRIENQQYKYLVKGEYVEFKIVPSTKPGNSDDKFNAVDITGIQGGKLMCETNYTEYIPKSNRPVYHSTERSERSERSEINGSNGIDVDVVSPQVLSRRPTYTNPPFTDGGRGGGRGAGRGAGRGSGAGRGPFIGIAKRRGPQ
jgi:cold shock CspA family protein